LRLDLVKAVRLAPCTTIRTYFIVAIVSMETYSFMILKCFDVILHAVVL